MILIRRKIDGLLKNKSKNSKMAETIAHQTTISKLSKPQIINILKIKYLRDDAKSGAIHENKYYAEMAKNYFDSKVIGDSKSAEYATLFQKITKEAFKDAEALKINVTETKFADEFTKYKPKASYHGVDWPTDTVLAQKALMTLCQSGLLEDKKHKPIKDVLNNFYEKDALEYKAAIAAKKAEAKNKAKTAAGIQEKKDAIKKRIENAEKAMKKLMEDKPVKAKASTSAVSTTIEESEAEETEDEETEEETDE